MMLELTLNIDGALFTVRAEQNGLGSVILSNRFGQRVAVTTDDARKLAADLEDMALMMRRFLLGE